MKSLGLKLTLSFLAVSLLGILLVTGILTTIVRNQFDRFIFEQDVNQFSEFVTEYYEEHQTFDQFSAYLDTIDLYFPPRQRIALLDENQEMLFQRPPNWRLDSAPAQSLQIVVNKQQVATIIYEPTGSEQTNPEHRNPTDGFLQDLTQATILSGMIATLLALGTGVVIARQIMNPIVALTDATQSMADGQLGQQVPVRGNDEIGRLAISFNQMSEALTHENQLRRQMTADIAHDLRTPLSVLQGYLEGLKDGDLQGSAELYGLLFDEAKHLGHLIEDLRTLSLADAGELRLNKRLVSPYLLLERTGMAFMIQAEQKGIALKIETNHDAPIPLVDVDIERMVQVLHNLVSNSLNYTDTGMIQLSAKAEQGQVILSVTDTGDGIDPEKLPFLFDRFYRVDSSRTQHDSHRSSGLGLAIAKAIVTAHDGEISAHSQGKGHGTTIQIRLSAHSPKKEHG